MDESDYKPETVSDTELPALATEVRHEYDMFRMCATVLVNGGDRLHPVLRNVFVESLNIHARNLVGFFGGPKQPRASDDVFAIHYAPDWDRDRHGHIDLIWLETALVPGIHKRTAHITAYRTRVPPEWDAQRLVEIGAALSCLMARLLRLLPAERRAWFDRDGSGIDVAWVFRDIMGMDVNDGDVARLLGAGCDPLPLQFS